MPYNVIVIAREVWDTRDLVGSPLDDSSAVKKASLATRYEPEDLNALEMALRIKDANGGKVTALSIGAPGSVDAPREAGVGALCAGIRHRGIDVSDLDADICLGSAAESSPVKDQVRLRCYIDRNQGAIAGGVALRGVYGGWAVGHLGRGRPLPGLCCGIQARRRGCD